MRTLRATQPAIDLDAAQLDQIMGVKGNPNGGVYQFGVPLRDSITMEGVPVHAGQGQVHNLLIR